MIEREKKLEAAAKRTIPWLVLLGNHIGNGVPGDENGRCDALAALSEALGSADDVPRAIPGKKIVLTFDDVPGMRALLRHLAEHAFAIEDLLDSAACQAFDAEVERAIDVDEPGALVAPAPLVAPSLKSGFAGLNWRQAKALAERHIEQFQNTYGVASVGEEILARHPAAGDARALGLGVTRCEREGRESETPSARATTTG